MDQYEQALERLAPEVRAIARRGFRESGRGVVALSLAPDSHSFRYVTPVKGDIGPLAAAFKMTETYNPATTAVVHVFENQGVSDRSIFCCFMTFVEEGESDPLAQGLELRPGTPQEANLYIGEDQSFFERNNRQLAALAKRGYFAKGLGAVVIVREALEDGHWLLGHLEGELPPDDGSKAFYVPMKRLIEGPVTSLTKPASYDARSEGIFIFLRAGSGTMTYQMGI